MYLIFAFLKQLLRIDLYLLICEKANTILHNKNNQIMPTQIVNKKNRNQQKLYF